MLIEKRIILAMLATLYVGLGPMHFLHEAELTIERS